MRVLYVVTGAEFGGASQHVLQLMAHMIERGHQVAMVSAPEPRLLGEARELGATIFVNRHFEPTVPVVGDLLGLGSVVRAIRTFRPDLVTAHSTRAGFAARLSCALIGFEPIVFTAHGWSFAEGRPLWRRHLLAAGERVAARLTTRVVCVSQYDVQLALRFNVGTRHKIAVVYYGIDPRPFLETRRDIGREAFGCEGAPTVTMVGRLTTQKDPLTLLAACRLLKEPFRVLLVGDGPLRRDVEEAVRNDAKLRATVTVLGQQRRIPEILAASDIFALSSLWEGMPLAIIEAMMAGLPVVATSVVGVAELVEHGITGFLVSPRDPVQLASAIQRLLDHESLRRQLGAAGRSKAMGGFTANAMLGSTEAIYEELVSRKGPAPSGAIRLRQLTTALRQALIPTGSH